MTALVKVGRFIATFILVQGPGLTTFHPRYFFLAQLDCQHLLDRGPRRFSDAPAFVKGRILAIMGDLFSAEGLLISQFLFQEEGRVASHRRRRL
jgi:hypothetical protein